METRAAVAVAVAEECDDSAPANTVAATVSVVARIIIIVAAVVVAVQVAAVQVAAVAVAVVVAWSSPPTPRHTRLAGSSSLPCRHSSRTNVPSPCVVARTGDGPLRDTVPEPPDI